MNKLQRMLREGETTSPKSCKELFLKAILRIIMRQ